MINKIKKEGILFLIFTILFILGFFFINVNTPLGLTIYDIVNENITETNKTINLTENKIIINETNITEINITNIENQINITEIDFTEELIQLQAEINKPIKWIKKIKLNKTTNNLTIEISNNISNIKVNKIINEFKEEITPDKIKTIENKQVIEDNIKEIEIEYYTEAPKISEKEINENKKEITISSQTHYENILAYTTIKETTKESIKLYRTTGGIKELTQINNYKDTNNNNLIDYIEWTIPHLSNQTYEVIIEISKAEHLDSNREFIEDIYDHVKARDDVFKEIPINHYVRAVFKENLTSKKDITIYARSNNSGSVEVYEKDSDIKIADFGTISDNKKYQIFLDNLQSSSQDTFDLKIINQPVEFDQIIDPPEDGFTLIFNDTFTDSSGTALQSHPPDLGSSWIEIWQDAADLIVDSNDLGSDGGVNDGAADYINISGTIYEDQIAVMTYSTDDSIDDVLGLLVRADSTWANAYTFTWDQAGGSYTKLWKRNNSVNYDLNTTGCQSRNYVEGSVIKLKVTGTNPAVIEVYDDDVFVCGYTDSISPITSGRPGVHHGSHPDCLNICDEGAQKGDDFLAYHLEPDNDAPSFSNAINDTNINRHQNITMNITISDDIDIDNYTFSWNDTGSWVNTTFQLSGTLKTWSANVSENISANEGVTVSWKYYACDSSNNCNVSATENFTVANKYPKFSNPVNDTGIESKQNITMNITITDDTELSSYIFSWNDTGSWANDTAIIITGQTIVNANVSKNITASSTTIVSWRYYANDSSNNRNASGLYNFTVKDTLPPEITIVSPTGTIADVTPTLNLSISETSDRVWYNIDSGTNYTLCLSCSGNQIKYLHLAEGSYTIYVYANDSNGNLNNTESSSITISTGGRYDDTFNDYSSINTNSSITWNFGNVSFTGTSSDYGDGSDGELTISTKNTTINNYTYLQANVSASSTTLNVTNASEFSANDEILIIQMQNYSIGLAGTYELATISSISGTIITLTSGLENNYYTGVYSSTKFDGVNATVTQVVRVPQYTDVTINDEASITASDWNGSQGGIVIFKATGTVNVNGVINATGKGFRGGLAGVVTNPAWSGESITCRGLSSPKNNTGGGGGGHGGGVGIAGGGGGYSTVGEQGDLLTDGGGIYSNSSKVMLLGSGGGGGSGGSVGVGDSGLDGGGIIHITANKIIVTGNITSNGDYDHNAIPAGAGGGGGSGGSIYLIGDNLTLGTNLVNATGGDDTQEVGANGRGGDGRIRLDFNTLTGTTIPTYGYNGSAPGGGAGSGNFTAYSINTTSNIPLISNITWNESGTDATNNISVEVSVNNGLNWYTATKNQELSGFTANNTLIYRTLFTTDSATTIYLLDMNISWGEAAPTFSNPANGTGIEQNQNITMNITITDSTGLDNYTFSWNDTGSWVNFSSTDLGGSITTVNANTSRKISSAANTVISWRYYACDNSSNCADSGVYNFTVATAETDAPTFSNSKNNTGVKIYFNASMNITISEVTDIANYTFSWNNSGTWVNDTTVQLAGTQTSWVFNLTKNITNAVYNQVVQWKVYACDSNNYCGVSATENMTVANTAPSTPTNLIPTDNSSTTNRTPEFIWTNVTDNDNSSVTFEWFLDDNTDFTSTESKLSLSTNRTLPNDRLKVDTTHYWFARAYDGTDYSSNSSVFNVTISSSISIALPNATVNFSSLASGEKQNTSDGLPDPFRIRNDGNSFVDIVVAVSESLWTSVGLDTLYFQSKVRNISDVSEGNEFGAFNYSASNTTFFNLSSSNITFIKELDDNDTSDEAIIDIHVQVPVDDYGDKNSTLIFEGVLSSREQ